MRTKEEKIATPGPGASQEEWNKYLEAAGYGENVGEYKGGIRYEGFGLGVKSERQEREEDGHRRKHSRMCPINLGRRFY